jgi:DNA-binding CsgD family transcriptional regulator/tetratricopeptide (TPR) repeat protein
VSDEGRAAFQRRAWSDAYARFSEAARVGPLPHEDAERLAMAAYLVGAEDWAQAWERAYHDCVRADDVARAVWCAIWLAYGLLDRGEVALGGGWMGRAQTLIEGTTYDGAERGYLMIPAAIGCCEEDPAAALEMFGAARAIGERHADAGLTALAGMGQGQALVGLGRWAEAVPLLDEVMLAVAADEIPPIVAGNVLCGALDACNRILDLRRAREWTVALRRWCDTQPDLVPFRGQCLVHRAEIMQLQGDWPDAVDEAREACRLLSGRLARGDAFYRMAELHRVRGELSEAEEAYRSASLAGREPQPGLALLRLAQGQPDVAVAAIRRVLAETTDGSARARILGPYVEIMLAGAEHEAARTAADELAALAADIGTAYLRAVAAAAHGAVLLAAGDAEAALPALRQAWSGWRGLEVPYEAARVRMLIGLACRALGDVDGARMELDAARLGFSMLGAVTDLARVEALLASAGDPAGDPARAQAFGLTTREREVLALVAKGGSNREIAAALFISEHTVARHLQNILGKLGVPSRTAAGSLAYEHGLV